MAAGCPSIHSIPVLKSQPQPLASNQSVPSMTSSTPSDTSAMVYRHFSFSSNCSRTSPSIRIGVLFAAHIWRMEGLTSMSAKRLTRSFGTKVSSQPNLQDMELLFRVVTIEVDRICKFDLMLKPNASRNG